MNRRTVVRSVMAAACLLTVVGAGVIDATPSGAAQANTGASTFTSIPPVRLLDTRDGTGAPSAGAVAPGGTVQLLVGGVAGIPNGVGAVVLNVTVTEPQAAGYVTVYSDDAGQPLASNLNFSPGQTVPNLVIVPVSVGGYVDLYNGSSGTVQLIADASGYFFGSAGTPNGSYAPLSPSRMLDTRDGTGAPVGAVAPGGTVQLVVGGVDGVPANATSVVLNVTVTEPQAAGYITVYGDGSPQPLASNLNFTPGQTVPNLVAAPIGANGTVDLTNGSAGTVQLIADVAGYVVGQPASFLGSFASLSPTRLLDTRDGTGAPSAGAVASGGTVQLTVGGVAGVPSGATSVVLNVTVTEPQAAGYITVYGDGTAQPLASNLNFTPGQTVPNLVVAPVGSNGIVDLTNGSAGSVQLIADVAGYFSGAPAAAPLTYALALGDSGAAGWNGAIPPGHSYAQDLTAYEQTRISGLQLEDFACGGATTSSMFHANPDNTGFADCNPYPSAGPDASSQGDKFLDASNTPTYGQVEKAVKFLTDHRGQVKYITLSITANDLSGCMSSGAQSTAPFHPILNSLSAVNACLVSGNGTTVPTGGVTHVLATLHTIITDLHAAPGASAIPIIGADNHDPFLIDWLDGNPEVQDLSGIQGIADSVASQLATQYASDGAQMADTSAAFDSDNFALTGTGCGQAGLIPQNVANICNWTHMYSDIANGGVHSNNTGYLVMARTFAPLVDAVVPPG